MSAMACYRQLTRQGYNSAVNARRIGIGHWFVVAVGVGWIPLFAAETLTHVTSNYEVVGFGLAWGMVVTPLASLGALALGAVYLVKQLKSRNST
jgi:hypothetical protein